MADGGTGPPDDARKAMNTASKVDEDGPLFALAEAQPLQGELLGQVICWALSPNPKRDHHDFNRIEVGASGLMPLPWRHARFGSRHRREPCGFDRLGNILMSIVPQCGYNGAIMRARHMSSSELEFG